MNKIKKALEWAIDNRLKEIERLNDIYLAYYPSSHINANEDEELQQHIQNLIQFTALEFSLNKLLGEMDEFALIYCESIKHMSSEAKDKFLEFYNKLDLIIQGKEAYKSEEKKE